MGPSIVKDPKPCNTKTSAELWPHVLDHLNTRDTKNARYACPGLRTQACRALFHTIIIGPTIYHLNRLRNIVGQTHDGIGLVNYVKVVDFNLDPLWRGSWDEDPGREEEEDQTGQELVKL